MCHKAEDERVLNSLKKYIEETPEPKITIIRDAYNLRFVGTMILAVTLVALAIASIFSASIVPAIIFTLIMLLLFIVTAP